MDKSKSIFKANFSRVEWSPGVYFYRCNACGWDSFKLDEAQVHMNEHLSGTRPTVKTIAPEDLTTVKPSEELVSPNNEEKIRTKKSKKKTEE